jgi:hypothetical protein
MKYILENPSKETLYARKWRELKGEEYKKKQKEYWEKNKNKYLEIGRERANKYYQDHKEEAKKKVNDRYHKNKKLIGRPIGEQHTNWKGKNASYASIHHWVRRHKGRPNKCELCGTMDKKHYDWMNVDHQYKRDLNDYVRVCRRCHRLYDYKNKLSNKGSRWGSISNNK